MSHAMTGDHVTQPTFESRFFWKTVILDEMLEFHAKNN